MKKAMIKLCVVFGLLIPVLTSAQHNCPGTYCLKVSFSKIHYKIITNADIDNFFAVDEVTYDSIKLDALLDAANKDHGPYTLKYSKHLFDSACFSIKSIDYTNSFSVVGFDVFICYPRQDPTPSIHNEGACLNSSIAKKLFGPAQLIVTNIHFFDPTLNAMIFIPSIGIDLK